MTDKIIVKKPPKSPFLAGVLSFFFPLGAAPLYNGQVTKALIHFFVFAGLVSMQESGYGQPFLGLMLAGFWIYQIIDSVQVSKDINRLAESGETMSEAKLTEVPAVLKQGSIFWGAVLMVLGAVLLLANFEIFSYETLFDFWPVAVIALGLKLVADHLSQKKS